MQQADSHVSQRLPFTRTLMFRIFKAFSFFNILLTLGYALAVSYYTNRIHQQLELNQLQARVNAYIAHMRSAPDQPLGIPPFDTTYEQIENVPMPFRAILSPLSDGFYLSEGRKGVGGPGLYRYVITSIPEFNKRVYFIFDGRLFEKNFNLQNKIFLVFIIGFIISIFLSIIIGYYTARMLTKPISRLVGKIIKSQPENLPVLFSASFRHDEIGILARALDDSNQRIRRFIERELQFTRDASHELRTPVTVIKGAVELISQLNNDPNRKIDRPLKRIERSVSEMEHLIEALLHKAREDAAHTSFELSPIQMIEQALREGRYLVKNKDVILNFVHTGVPAESVAIPDFKIAISNLLRNACAYTQSGYVSILFTHEFFEIVDTGPGIAPEILDQVTTVFIKSDTSQGYGVGLAIVKRICDQYEWTLSISNTNPGTKIRISF